MLAASSSSSVLASFITPHPLLQSGEPLSTLELPVSAVSTAASTLAPPVALPSLNDSASTASSSQSSSDRSPIIAHPGEVPVANAGPAMRTHTPSTPLSDNCSSYGLQSDSPSAHLTSLTIAVPKHGLLSRAPDSTSAAPFQRRQVCGCGRLRTGVGKSVII